MSIYLMNKTVEGQCKHGQMLCGNEESRYHHTLNQEIIRYLRIVTIKIDWYNITIHEVSSGYNSCRFVS